MPGRNKLELKGQKFGRLTVLYEHPVRSNQGDVKWMCKCDCGNYIVVGGSNVKSGNSSSCGCYFKKCVKERFLKHGESVDYSSEYTTWQKMKSRCLNPNDKVYNYYGGRGITVDERWINSFQNFLTDMGRKPSPMHSLDRFPNQNGGYGPLNCRWATRIQQTRNKTNNIWIEYDSRRMILSDWAKELDIQKDYFSYHFKRGKTVDNIIESYKKRQLDAAAFDKQF